VFAAHARIISSHTHISIHRLCIHILKLHALTNLFAASDTVHHCCNTLINNNTITNNINNNSDNAAAAHEAAQLRVNPSDYLSRVARVLEANRVLNRRDGSGSHMQRSAAVYLLPSLLNHSCCPNAAQVQMLPLVSYNRSIMLCC
jgi:hypothetical protein